MPLLTMGQIRTFESREIQGLRDTHQSYQVTLFFVEHPHRFNSSDPASYRVGNPIRAPEHT